MRILVVDDDKIVLDSCRYVLETEGFEVVLKSSAAEALETMEEEAFDVLLVDVIMPEYDGISLIADVKRRWPKLSVIVMSGYPTPEVIIKGKDAGALHFIPKPFKPTELLDAIRMFHDKSNSNMRRKSDGTNKDSGN